MKTFLLSFLFIGLISFNKVNAQACSLANFQFVNVYTASDGKCYADISFDMDRNNGNKFIYLHFWTQANYAKVDLASFMSGSGPLAADINGTSSNSHPSLATLAIDNSNYNSPKWSSYNYRPDQTVATVTGSAISVSSSPVSGSGANTMYRYFINGIPLGSLGGGCTASNLRVIVWSTQSNSANSHIQCSLVGPAAPRAPLNISGSANCATAKYTINLENTNSTAVSGAINIYADNGIRPNDGVFDPSTDTKFDVVSSFTVNPNSTLTLTRSIPAQYLGYDLFAQVILSDGATQVQKLLTTSCGILPVKFQSFTATRFNQNVAVKWQTASEQNVRGFNVQRLTDEGEWKNVAYVPSQSAGGFSSQALAYQYSDLNNYKGVSQYRIQEMEADGKAGLSDVKMVRGEASQTKLTMYPNPSGDGKVNLVFDDNSVRDIVVFDISGRTVKQLNGVSNSNVLIDNLNTGFYNVQVRDRNTNETTTEKLIIKR